jgi:hypothetical protein
MKNITYIFAVTLMSMVLFGCGGAEDKVVINYCTALDKGMLAEAAGYLAKDAKNELDRTGGVTLLGDASKKFKEHKGIREIKITRKKVDGESAIVEFRYIFNDGSKFDDFFPLVKEGGKWRISK